MSRIVCKGDMDGKRVVEANNPAPSLKKRKLPSNFIIFKKKKCSKIKKMNSIGSGQSRGGRTGKGQKAGKLSRKVKGVRKERRRRKKLDYQKLHKTGEHVLKQGSQGSGVATPESSPSSSRRPCRREKEKAEAVKERKKEEVRRMFDAQSRSSETAAARLDGVPVEEMSGEVLKKVLEAVLEEEDAATANDRRKKSIFNALKRISEGGEVSKIGKEMAESYIRKLNVEYLFKGCGDVDANAATDLVEKYESSRKFGVTRCSCCKMLVIRFGKSGLEKREQIKCQFCKRNPTCFDEFTLLPTPEALKVLNTWEVLLITRVLTHGYIQVMKGGQSMMRGHIVSFNVPVCIAARLPRLPSSVRVLILVSKKNNLKIIRKDKVIQALKVLKFGLPHNGVAEPSINYPHQCGDRFYQHPPQPGYQTVTIDETLDIENTSAWNFEFDPQDFHLDEEEDCGPAPKQQSNEDEKVQNIAGVTADVADADLQEVFHDIAKQLDLTKEQVRELLPEAIATGGTICNPSVPIKGMPTVKRRMMG